MIYVITPLLLPSDFWVSVLNFAGIAAIGAMGLNLLTGYTGQVSLGHGFFLGAGAYTTGYVGSDLGLHFVIAILAAALVGAVLGALIGPFALRLTGNYLVLITFGLVIVGLHIFRNWESLTGGLAGRSTRVPADFLIFNFDRPAEYGLPITRHQAYFYLIWLLVAVATMMAANIVRSRPGRALQAVRDQDTMASILGIHVARYKIVAFAVSSAYASAAGGLYATYSQFVSSTQWDLLLSVHYIAIIIVGGMGTIGGAVLGALFLGGLPRVVEQFSHYLPLVADAHGRGGLLTVYELNHVIFGLLIVVFLVAEPKGLVALVGRITAGVGRRLT